MERFEQDDELRALFAAEKSRAAAEAQLPDAAFPYWRALEAERERARAKALRPIVLVERFALLSVGVGIAVAGALFTPEIGWTGIHFPAAGPVTAALLLGVPLALFVGWLVWAEE